MSKAKWVDCPSPWKAKIFNCVAIYISWFKILWLHCFRKYPPFQTDTLGLGCVNDVLLQANLEVSMDAYFLIDTTPMILLSDWLCKF